MNKLSNYLSPGDLIILSKAPKRKLKNNEILKKDYEIIKAVFKKIANETTNFQFPQEVSPYFKAEGSTEEERKEFILKNIEQLLIQKSGDQSSSCSKDEPSSKLLEEKQQVLKDLATLLTRNIGREIVLKLLNSEDIIYLRPAKPTKIIVLDNQDKRLVRAQGWENFGANLIGMTHSAEYKSYNRDSHPRQGRWQTQGQQVAITGYTNTNDYYPLNENALRQEFNLLLRATADSFPEKIPTNLLNAIISGAVGDVKAMLQSNPLLANYANTEGFTALQIAIINGRKKVAKVLVEYGADHTVTTKNGSTLQQLALESTSKLGKTTTVVNVEEYSKKQKAVKTRSIVQQILSEVGSKNNTDGILKLIENKFVIKIIKTTTNKRVFSGESGYPLRETEISVLFTFAKKKKEEKRVISGKKTFSPNQSMIDWLNTLPSTSGS